MAMVRRPKWHPPPAQTPRILQLPLPLRRRQPTRSAEQRRAPKGQLETLFGQERTFCYTIPSVVLLNSKDRGRGDENGLWEEKWRFQAEILRAECKFLRTEKEIAAKKFDRERAFIERTLKSSVHALISAKKKIGEGENVNTVLEEEIEGLTKRVVEVQRSSKKPTRRDPQLLKGSSRNLDKGTTLLQKQVQRIGGIPTEKSKMNVHDIVKANLSKESVPIPNEACNKLADVEILRRKMEGLSKGELLKKMEEEYGLMLSGTVNNTASTSKITCSLQEHLQEQNICAGHCKGIVRRIMEQVRAETEQWSQMQGMLGQVREEMEELQASRDFWEDRALDCDYKIKSLNQTVQEWKETASSLEVKEKKLEDVVKLLQEELDRVRSKELAAPQSQGKENKVLTCRVKGHRQVDETCIKTRNILNDGKKATHNNGGSKLVVSPSRMPFLDIGNLSPLVRQNSRRPVFPLPSPQRV